MTYLSYFILVIVIITVTINIIISLFVYTRNPNSATHKIFGFLGLVISFWLSIHYVSTLAFTSSLNLFLIRLSILLVAVMDLLFFLLSHTLPANKLRIKKSNFVILSLATLFIMIVALSPYTFTHVEIINNFPNPLPGPAIVLFGIFVISSILGSTYVLYVRSKVSVGREKVQLRLLMLGIILMNGLMIFTVLLPIALFRNNQFVTLAPFYTLFFLGLTAYAIIKHRFLDIRVVVARSVAYLLVLLIIILIYSGGIFFISNYILISPDPMLNLIFSTVFTLVIALSFQSLRRLLEKWTEKVFYKRRYDSAKLLGDLSHVMASNLDLSILSELILEKVTTEINISFAFLLLTRNSIITWIKSAGTVRHPPEFNEKRILNLIEWVTKKPGENLLVFDELEESDEKNIMREHNISVVLPLVVKDELIGSILLGERSSGDIYTGQDIEILNILAPEMAVAIKNAISYDEIKRFNITLEQEVEQATSSLQKVNERLKEVDKLKDEFVSLASHELRTPMTIIRSYLWFILNDKEVQIPEKSTLYLQRAYKTTTELIGMVNDMLNVSRIESGRLTINISRINIASFLKDLSAELDPEAKELGINLSLTNTLPDKTEVLADPERLKQILINLLGNAFKFTPKSGTITVNSTESNGMVLVSVKDSGSGISGEDLPKLFQKFGLVENDEVKKQNRQGTGLGLYISKSLVELQGGKIWAESPGKDKGTTFYFTLKKA